MADAEYADDAIVEGDEGNEEGEEAELFEDSFDGDVPSLDPNDVRETTIPSVH